MTDNADQNSAAKHAQLTGRVARWTAILTLGVLALSVGYDSKRTMLTPGPLSPPHRAIDDCSACHSNVGKQQFGWASAILSRTDAHADNTRCLTCHQLGDAPHTPHNLPARRLAQTTKEKQKQISETTDATSMANAANELLATALGMTGRNHAGIGCATCHSEHRRTDGAAHTATDRTCNACHQVSFTSFQTDHPDFTGYASRKPVSIKYDHSKHFSEHFEKARKNQPDLKSMPKACTDCHTPTAEGATLGLKSFDETCSSCHLPQIVGADRATGPKGIALFALPGLDLETLKARRAPIGKWPEDTEAELSPLMRVLLARDDKRRALLQRTDKLDLFDLQSATKADIKDVTHLVWEIKELLDELSGAKAVRILKRVRAATSVSLDRADITRMLGTLPRDVLIAAVKNWLPSLDKELARRQRPGWQKALRPKTAAPKRPKKAKEVASEAEPKPQTKLVQNPKGGRWYVSVLGEIVQEGLEPKETRMAARGEVEEVRKASAKPPPKAASKPSGKTPEAKTAQPRRPPIDDETWSEYGGWYRKDYAIYYRPGQHADPFVRSWLDFSATGQGAAKVAVLALVFEELTDKDAQGRCTKCHSIDEGTRGPARVVWGSDVPSQDGDKFTHFSHAPHLSMLDKRGCLTCHELLKPEKTKLVTATAQQSKPPPAQPSFKPIKKVTCVACHATGKAPQNCQQCHTYHTAPTGPPLTPTRLPVEAVTQQN